MTYHIKGRVFKGVTGDPSWPHPVYEFKDEYTIDTDVQIVKGDLVDNRKVIEINHTKDGTCVIVEGA